MSEQTENTSDELEGDKAETEYEGDLGDGAKKGSGAGIIGLGSCI